MKFTIRDLFLVTMIVALAVGWWADSRRRGQLERDLAAAKAETQEDKKAIEKYFKMMVKIERELPSHGLVFDWPGPTLTRLEPKNSLPNSQAPTPNPPKP